MKPTPLRFAFVACGLLIAHAHAAMPPIPAVQKQYRHPEAAYTEDFAWHMESLSGLQPVGPLVSWRQLDANTVLLDLGSLEAKVTAPHAGVLRLQLYEKEREFSWPKDFCSGVRFDHFRLQAISIRETDDSIIVESADQKLVFLRDHLSITLTDAAGKTLLAWNDLHIARRDHGLRSYARFSLHPDDHFFGLGGKTSPLDRRGQQSDIYSVKVETKRGDYGGFAFPYFLNPRGYGLILNNPYPRVFFDFGLDSPDQWTLTTPDGPLDFFFLAGTTPQQINRHYHALTGAPAIPPKYMLGLWASWFSTANATDWAGYMQRFREERWPVDIMLLDLYWRGGMFFMSEGGQGHNLDWDFEKFGNGPALLKTVQALNIKSILHVNTRMFLDPVRSEGLTRGYLRESQYDQVVGALESQESRDWNWDLYAPRVAEGTSSWWIDNGERVNGTLSNGLPSRNLYGEVWNEFLFERMVKAGFKNPLVLARGGWLGTQTNTTQWPGDTAPGAERQREDLWFTGNLAMSGVPYTGVDLGGFKADGVDRDLMHTDENIIRRVAHGFLLYAMPRLHNSYRTDHKFPWRYNEQVRAVYRQYLELRYALAPYYYSAAVESSTEAIPMIRPLVYDHFNDPRTYTEDATLLVGPSLLMAPIMDSGGHSRHVYLPEGNWFNYWTGEKSSGERHVLVDAPLYARHGLPIFVREGAILPSRPPVQFNREEPEPIVHLDLYPGTTAVASYKLWEKETTASILSYTQENQLLTLQLRNNTSLTRTYTFACRDGRSVTHAEALRKTLPVNSGIVEVILTAGSEVSVVLTLNP